MNSGRWRRWLRWWRRKRQTSRPEQLALDAAHILAMLGQAGCAAILAWISLPASSWASPVLFVCVVYSTLYDLVLGSAFRRTRIEEEKGRRAERLATALFSLAEQIRSGPTTQPDIQRMGLEEFLKAALTPAMSLIGIYLVLRQQGNLWPVE